jgi:hypothetical protein
MRVRYRCKVRGNLRVSQNYTILAGEIQYELELGKAGELTHVCATLQVDDRSLWPSILPSKFPGIALHINITHPFIDLVRADLRSAEGLLALYGVESIEIDSAEQTWLPDSPEEKQGLPFYEYSHKREQTSVEEMPIAPFDLAARVFLAAKRSHDIEVALSSYRKGKTDVIQNRYIEAIFDFLFMLESLFAKGKFKKLEVEKVYLDNDVLIEHVRNASSEPMLQTLVRRDASVLKRYLQDYEGKSPTEVIKHLVDLRGFLHHHSQGRKDIWHPEDHIRFGADAFFLQQLCFNIAFKLAESRLFSPEVIQEYEQLATAWTRNLET